LPHPFREIEIHLRHAVWHRSYGIAHFHFVNHVGNRYEPGGRARRPTKEWSRLGSFRAPPISLEEAMKTIVPAALVVLALAVVPAHAHKAQQGVSLNGVNLNGVSLNGSMNGLSLNGTSLNSPLNGLSLNGAMNGVQLNGVVHQGLGNGTTAGLIGSATLIEVELPR
jgi:hypothetical protein